LDKNYQAILSGSFIKNYVEDVLRTIRTQVILQIIVPYSSISLTSLTRSLGGNISLGEVEELLVELVLDEKIQGRLDALEGILVLDTAKQGEDFRLMEKRYETMNSLCSSMNSALKHAIAKIP
jgi:COP9 signalosome complex subunit 2